MQKGLIGSWNIISGATNNFCSEKGSWNIISGGLNSFQMRRQLFNHTECKKVLRLCVTFLDLKIY